MNTHSTVAPATSLKAYPAFWRYWVTRLTSAFGFQVISVAVGWQVYDITGDPLTLGLIGLAQFIPSVLLALPAGHVADQFHRRNIVLVTQSCQWLALLALVGGSWFELLNEQMILLLVFIIGVFKAFEFPALKSMLPALVPDEVLPRALAMDSSGIQMASIAGPALGGLLYIGGPVVAYGLAACLYFISLVGLFGLRYHHTIPKKQPMNLTNLFAGVRFIRARPVILGVISLDLFAVLLGGATALLPIFAKDILHTGPWGLGLLRAAPAVGALLMSFWLARNSLERNVGKIMFGAVAGFGVATLVFALSTNLYLSLIALFALGAFDMVSMVIRGALVQLETPDEMRGRVTAVNSIFINTSNQLGEFESGVLAAAVGAVGSAVIGGVGTLVVVAAWMWMFPVIRERQKLKE
ncbi:MFS transporter [Shewanella avicenniae]|uniref:MFS transporter n=1 Tax=Shewanella avicenniae TaxID=2814294 RepID=A0ABX7QNW2_9GAMM|nr:MFS transporter [Shewanella avicenniae]QSX32944.1 MFS transporter [Shewanella avicenniae]